MFANDGILSKSPVLILIRVYRQRSPWRCTDNSFPNKMCKWKIWQNGETLEATASSKGSTEFLKYNQVWTVTSFFIYWNVKDTSLQLWHQLWGEECTSFLLGTISVCARTLIINIAEKHKYRVSQEGQGLGSCCLLPNLECICPLLQREWGRCLKTRETDSVWRAAGYCHQIKTPCLRAVNVIFLFFLWLYTILFPQLGCVHHYQ